MKSKLRFLHINNHLNLRTEGRALQSILQNGVALNIIRADTPTFAEDKSAQEVVSGGPRSHPLPSGVV